MPIQTVLNILIMQYCLKRSKGLNYIFSFEVLNLLIGFSEFTGVVRLEYPGQVCHDRWHILLSASSDY